MGQRPRESEETSMTEKEKTDQRKERTRRLIQNGALAEKYLCCEGMPPNEFEKRLRMMLEISD